MLGTGPYYWPAQPGSLIESATATPIRGGHLTTFPHIYSFLYRSLVNHHPHYIYIKPIFLLNRGYNAAEWLAGRLYCMQLSYENVRNWFYCYSIWWVWWWECKIQNPEVGDGFLNSVDTHETNYVSSVWHHINCWATRLCSIQSLNSSALPLPTPPWQICVPRCHVRP